MQIFRTLLFVFAFAIVFADPTICLNMIVRNESHVIRNCLASVKDYIHYWVIVDTGSNDGTQAIIKECLADIPGELHERPWVDFGTNRTEAIILAKGKCDYIFTIDADEVLICEPGFDLSHLDKDLYQFIIRQGETGIDYKRILLVNDQCSWWYEGVMHETIRSDNAKTSLTMPHALVMSYTNGYRSKDPDKYRKDAAILEKALEKDPTNSRHQYYLAQSYLNIPDYPKALEAYKKRTTMGGWDEEVFFSFYQVAMIQQEILKLPEEVVIKSHNDAFQYRPTRLEPLYQIIKIYLNQRNYGLAYALLKYALSMPMSQDAVFVQTWIYDWGFLCEYAECTFALGLHKETSNAVQKLLAKESLPIEIRNQINKNLSLLKF